MENKFCALCKNNNELKLSHVMPKFLFKSLKKSAVTGHMRMANEANKRVQDGLKIPLLCDACEGKFSELEKKFSDNIYRPILKDEENFSFEYKGDWLKKFLISVAWRHLLVSQIEGNFGGFEPHEMELVNEKIEDWRQYLNNEKMGCNDTVRLFPLTKKYRDSGIYLDEVFPNYHIRSIDLAHDITGKGDLYRNQ